MTMKTYPVLSPILADRKYEEGETIDLDENQTKELFFYGAIGEAIGAAAPAKLKATDAINLIAAAATMEAVDAILIDDQRVSVVAAANARKAELAG